MKKIALIGHSHAISVLDALGDWRTEMRLDNGERDARYTRAFQGWLSATTHGKLFSFRTFAEFEELSEIQVCLITPATFSGELATLTRDAAGEATLGATSFLAEFVEKVSNFDAIVSVIYGNEHASVLMDNRPEYDFFPYEQSKRGQPIDSMYVDALISQFTSRVVATLAYIRSVMNNATILHIPPPPPLRRPAEASVHEVLEDSIKMHGLIRSSLYKKWHTMYVNKLRTQIEPWNVMLIDPRFDEACEDGFLRPEFAEGLTHGNSAYGRLVATQVMQLLDLKSTSALSHGQSRNELAIRGGSSGEEMLLQTQRLAERERQISNLKQTITWRDEQVGNLNNVIAERETQIDNLNNAIAEREAQIDNLNNVIAEREAQIRGFNEAAVERDSHVRNLEQTIADRLEVIGTLNRALAESRRPRWIYLLGQLCRRLYSPR